MIVLFHLFSYFVNKIMKNIGLFYKCSLVNDENNCTIICKKDAEYNIKFDPPAYLQRYGQVYQTLLNEKWRKDVNKLIDFGCSEFGLFIYIKRLINLNELIFIDIDEDLLLDNLYKLRPLTVEYLKRRDNPLNINVFCGSVSNPDPQLLNTDAVVAIELIEHLYPDVLEAFPYNIFGYIQPKLVIITTPNADFNVVFNNKNMKFRHYDHKFEWSRQQFEDWAYNIVTRFPEYDVSFDGIAYGPSGTEKYGCCSQMALFVKKEENLELSKINLCKCDKNNVCQSNNDCTKMCCNCLCDICCPTSSFGVCTYFTFSINFPTCKDGFFKNKFLEKIEYPYEQDSRTQEEKLIDEFKYRVNYFGQPYGRFFNEETNRSEIPLDSILYGPDGAFLGVPELNTLLQKIGYKTEECIIQETGRREICVLYEPVMDDTTSESEASGYESSENQVFKAESMSDWDESSQKDNQNKHRNELKKQKDKKERKRS
ncbi:unnamed protein product [Brassicogethes aeneus]|uniref:Small RNA 2'-O-methyltransferase n=1 Tax=Brassicogethes aeneus TaxID=1431903 RepID=A0A9P0B1U4_BRAAE|nr:unnamed protein product [Brassicogethes aeneus]